MGSVHWPQFELHAAVVRITGFHGILLPRKQARLFPTDAGAIVVGTQKSSRCENGEVATAYWVDCHGPSNPRAGGYQDTASSSTRAGSSMASCEWLNLAVGCDTGSSMRGPAGLGGLFGSRPTHGTVQLRHAMPPSPTMDTAGFLARDPSLMDAKSKAL